MTAIRVHVRDRNDFDEQLLSNDFGEHLLLSFVDPSSSAGRAQGS